MMKSMIFLFCCMYFSNGQKDRTDRAAFAGHSNLIIAHRGLTSLHLENTLDALRAAFLHGADGVEFDVQLSRDLVPMVFHDRELMRLAHVDANIDELSAQELAGLWQSGPAYAAKYPIATLEEVLSAMPEKKLINIELKETTGMLGPEGISSVLRVIRPYKHKLDIVISSFEPEILDLVSQSDPQYSLALLVDREDVLSAWINARNLVGKVDYINPHISLVNSKTSKIIKNMGIKLILWGHKKMGEENIFFADQHTALISDVAQELIKQYK